MPATHKVLGCNRICKNTIFEVVLSTESLQRLSAMYHSLHYPCRLSDRGSHTADKQPFGPMYHQGDADFTGLAGFCRWRHDQQAPVLQARWHCLVNPPLLGNSSQGEREGESKSERERERETWRENVQCQGFIRGQPDDSSGCRCVYMKAGNVCGANFSQKSGCIQG